VIEEDQMLVDVNPLAFHRVARDARDGFTSSYSATVARNPLRVGDSRKSESSAGKQDMRAKSGHSETPDLDSRNLLRGAAYRKIGR
jgi:hypothetical protein